MQARDRVLEVWFNRIRSGQLLLPRFQRFEAWDYDNVAALIDSILRDLPIGSTLILETGGSNPFHARKLSGAPEPSEPCNEHLLDGQQRLTGLWRAMHDQYPDVSFFVYLAEPPLDDQGIQPLRILKQKRWISRDGRKFPLWADQPKELIKMGIAPVSLLQPSDISAVRQSWCDEAVGNDLQQSRELESRLRDLQDKVKRFNLPMLVLESSTKPATALDVFVKMNTSAVQLNAFDIVVAQFEARVGRSMHDLMIDLKEKCPNLTNYASAEQLVLQTAALRTDKTPSQANFLQLDLADVDTAWEEITQGIIWAINILDAERIFDSQRLPTIVVIPVLAALHKYLPYALDELGNATATIRRYMWRSFITSRYENSSSTRSLQDFRGLRSHFKDGSPKGEVPVFSEQEYPLPTVEEIMEAGWPNRKDSLARAIMLISLKAGAIDIADGSPISGQNIKNREYHHLFPDSLLKSEAHLPDRQRSRALNCVLITMNTNRNIAAKEPLKYLAERTARADLGVEIVKDRMRSHVVPFDELNVGGGYAIIEEAADRAIRVQADYENFLKSRAVMIYAAMKSLADGKNWPQEGI